MRLYRALLHLYPASFRREYGGEMQADFARRLHDSTGFPAKTMVWIAALLDVLRHALGAHWDLLRQDLRYSARTLARTPGFAIAAILVTALGVGANTAAFSVADFVLIRPLPFREPERLMKVWQSPPGYGRLEISPVLYRDWKAMARSFEVMGGYHGVSVNLVGNGDPQRLQGTAVTFEVMPTLGVQPQMGRFFTAADERQESSGPVIVSYGLWQSAFGGDASVIGRRVLLDGASRTIVGVMPQHFHFPTRDVSIWTPIPTSAQNDTDRGNTYWQVLAKLKRGVTFEQAQAEMTVIAKRLEQQYPKAHERTGATVYRLRDEVSGKSRLLLIALCGAALCVLLIACANLANLLLARAIARRRELVVRTALGAGRERLVRQLVTESLVLAGLGGALGVIIAMIAVPMLARLIPATLPIAQTPSVDLRVLLFAALVTGMTGMGFGVLPALQASSGVDLSALREGARAGGGRRARLRSALVISEVTASVVLLISAGLLMRALLRVQSTDPGFRTEGVMTMRTALPTPKYDSVFTRQRFYTHVLTNVRALPGVTNAAYSSFLPIVMGGGIWTVDIAGETYAPGEKPHVSMRFLTPGYFSSMSIPLKEGRDVSESDAADQPFVAVVSESFAREHWPQSSALGKSFKIASSERTVVGVVGDVRVRGLEKESEPQVYLPYRQVDDGSMSYYVPKDLVVRTSGAPQSLLPNIRRIVREADPQQPISNVQTLEQIVSDETASRAVQLRVLGAFALIAVLLAGIGIHGLLSFTVSQRRHEIGVRLALGAQSSTIVRMIMRQGAILAIVGVVPGVALAYVAGRTMQALLAGVQPTDALTVSVAVSVCVVTALLGTLLPVMRAVKVAPASAFRGE